MMRRLVSGMLLGSTLPWIVGAEGEAALEALDRLFRVVRAHDE